MARIGLVAVLCAAPFLCSTSLSADPVKEPEGTVESYLIAQTAPIHAEMYLMQHQPAKAVEVLEAPLGKVSVNRKYLAVLRSAYRAYINELTLKNQKELAEKYANRLRILEKNGIPGQQQTPTAAQSTTPASPAPVVPATLAGGIGTQSTKPAAPAPTTIKARGKPYAPDPFDASNKASYTVEAAPLHGKAAALLAQAEQEFARRQYSAAWKLYEDAHHADARVTQRCHDRWAYCKLHRVVEQLNNDDATTCDWAALDREVRTAMALSSKLEKAGNGLLKQIHERRDSTTVKPQAATRPQAAAAVKHLPRNGQGWDVAETQHFRILHKQPREFAEKVGQVAEQTRVAMYRKWFGTDGEAWNPKCDIYLHTTARDYGHFTGLATSSPGHSGTNTDPTTGRVVMRVIHLHCENPTALLSAVLPHEATHIVLAGKFGRAPVPRWADEGMAVLTEPEEKVVQHRRNLGRYRGDLFEVRELMQMRDYPQPRRISAFYAQSVSLVHYLCKQRGPQTFAAFLRDGMREGYEPALRRHYQIQGFADLQGRWRQDVAGDLRGEAAARLP